MPHENITFEEMKSVLHKPQTNSTDKPDDNL